ncbi:MAG: TonB-dependent receptor plug domain-containing protein [Steroidobacteraceae bacterium]
MNIRGFSAFNDFFIDGIRDAAVYTRDIFDADSVEVLEGPSAVLFGRGSTGGAINQVTKAPLLTRLENLQSMVGTNDLFRTTADFNFPFAAASAFRVNLMGESSEVAGSDFAKNRRWGIARPLRLASAARTPSPSPTCISTRTMFRTMASPFSTRPGASAARQQFRTDQRYQYGDR